MIKTRLATMFEFETANRIGLHEEAKIKNKYHVSHFGCKTFVPVKIIPKS